MRGSAGRISVLTAQLADPLKRKTEVMGECAIEHSDDEMDWPEYQTIQRSSWEQKILVPVSHDGKKHTRAEFQSKLRDRLERCFWLHDWIKIHQSHALIDRDTKTGSKAANGTVDFIQKYSHQRDTDTTCEKKIQTTICALWLEHSPRILDVTKRKHAMKRWTLAQDSFSAEEVVPIYDVNRVVECDVHLALSPEKEQDQAIYGEAFSRIAKEYQSGLLPSLDEIYMQSDRCASQFCGARNFAFVARFHEIVPGVTMQHDFTAAKHGKGKSDGAGAHLKSDCDRAEVKGENDDGESLMMLDAAAMYRVERKRVSLGTSYSDYTADENARTPPAVINTDGSLPESTVARRKLHLL
jgi:hypothetical protein